MVTLTLPERSLFGMANLPYGVYSVIDAGRARPRVATRYGDHVVDLTLLLGDDVFAEPSLNPFLAQGLARWREVRADLATALAGDVPAAAVHELGRVRLHCPVEVGDYVDFYASEHHAATLGRILRPGSEPLHPNWRHLPVGYHGRAGSVVVSGTDVRRPCGQRLEDGADRPVFGPSVRLDLEAEVGFVVGAGSAMGEPVAPSSAEEHLFGVVVVNDWSARDLQAWEYVPLGPHLGKSFATTVSPWVVPLAALEAARTPTPTQHPPVLPHLAMSPPWGLDLTLEVRLNGHLLSRPPYASTYWSPAQLLAHLTSAGAPTRPGDLLGSGTVSGREPDQRGSLIELTWNGARPLRLGGSGETRGFLADGDEVVLTATAPATDGSRIGFGEARGRILPARRPRA